MVDSVPYTTYALPWEDDAPDKEGSSSSDGMIMEQEMVAVGFSNQFVRVYKSPPAQFTVKLTGVVQFPKDDYKTDIPGTYQAPSSTARPSHYAYQDIETFTAYGNPISGEIPLGAPPIPTGDTFTRLGS